MDEYTGEERRRDQRRTQVDRRQELRWEPEKDDRRKGQGRRKEDRLKIYSL